MLVSPTTPTTAFPLGEKVDDPLAMYLFDLCTLPLNLAGHCGMSVPSGLSADDELPVGLQIMAPALADDRLYRVGAAYEAARGRCRRHLVASSATASSGRRGILRPRSRLTAPRGKMKACGSEFSPEAATVLDSTPSSGRWCAPATPGTARRWSDSRTAGAGCWRTGACSWPTTTATTGCWPRAERCWAPPACTPDKLRAGLDQIKQTLDDNGIDVLIPIGGEGTLTAAHWLSEENVPVVGVPKTIDNDIDCTDVTFGHDTALTVATDAIDRLHSTAESHQRVMLVEVMGRHAGWIALNSGLASGAHMTLIPEQPFDIDEVCRLVKRRFQRGDSHFICVVAEGAKPIRRLDQACARAALTSSVTSGSPASPRSWLSRWRSGSTRKSG